MICILTSVYIYTLHIYTHTHSRVLCGWNTMTLYIYIIWICISIIISPINLYDYWRRGNGSNVMPKIRVRRTGIITYFWHLYSYVCTCVYIQSLPRVFSGRKLTPLYYKQYSMWAATVYLSRILRCVATNDISVQDYEFWYHRKPFCGTDVKKYPVESSHYLALLLLAT